MINKCDDDDDSNEEEERKETKRIKHNQLD